MAEDRDLPPPAEMPEAIARPDNRILPRLVWAVPIAAALIAGWLALNNWLDRGPTITITFLTAEGLEAGKTRVRYKEVDVGTVKSIGFTNDRSAVVVKAQMDKDAKPLLVDDARFWVVRPRITAGQAFGLSTLLAGAYVAMDTGKSKDEKRDFKGLETPPIITADVPGSKFVLRAESLGWTAVGAPVYYRGIRVGQIISTDLDKDGSGVAFQIFVSAPYDRYVTTTTRFWDAGGINVTISANGLNMDTESLFSILFGGVSFQTFNLARPGTPAKANHEFALHKNREVAARQPDAPGNKYVLYFKQSVRGLSVGAPVDFRGLGIGEVTRIMMDYDRDTVQFRSTVEIEVYPERFLERVRTGDKDVSDPERQSRVLQRFVDRGLRAQLRNANILTGQLYVALDFFPGVARASIKQTGTLPEIPTIQGGSQEIQAQVASVLAKIEKIPMEELSQDVRDTLAELRKTIGNVGSLAARADADVVPELRKTLDQARTTLQQLDGALSDASPLSGSVRGTLRDVSRAADTIRSLADYLERHPEALLRGKKEEKTR